MEEAEAIIRKLRALGEQKNVEGMKRYGIVSSAEILGASKPVLRKLAREIGVNHELALKLWETNIHEARVLATLIADPAKVCEELMEK